MNKRIEALLKILGLAIVFTGAYQAYLGYIQTAELQALRALHQEQLITCKKLVQGSSNLLAQDSSEKYRLAFDDFAKIKHGMALVLLDIATIDKAVEVYNAAIEPLTHGDDTTLRSKIRCSLGNKPFELAMACRSLISQAFRKESGSALSSIADNYTMGWSGECT